MGWMTGKAWKIHEVSLGMRKEFILISQGPGLQHAKWMFYLWASALGIVYEMVKGGSILGQIFS